MRHTLTREQHTAVVTTPDRRYERPTVSYNGAYEHVLYSETHAHQIIDTLTRAGYVL